MATQMLDVLVVGAGPVGLFCANELHRQGLTCRIIDKKSGLSEKSKALAIHIRSLDVLDDTGFIEEIVSQGHKIVGASFQADGKELVNLSFKDVEASRHFFIDLPQNKTEAILYEGLNNKGITVEWQTELTGIEQHSNHVVASIKHSDGQIEQLHAFWIIACDGSHSTLRELVQAKFSGEAYPETWWLADLNIHWDLPNDKIALFASSKGPLACFPIEGDRYRLVMTAEQKVSHQEPSMDDIVRVFNARAAIQATLSDPIWISQFGIAHRQIEHYRHGRIFFAGDAAHVHSPMGGQGLNTGLQDIYNLAWKLNLVQKNLAKEKILDSYHLERHPIGEQVLKKTGFLTHLFVLRNSFLIALRNQAVRLLASFGPVMKKITTDMAELNICYTKSPIVKQLGQSIAFKAGEFPSPFMLYEGSSKKGQSLQEITRGNLHHLFLFSAKEETHSSELLKIASTMKEKFSSLLKVHLVFPEETQTVNFESLFFDKNHEVYRRFNLSESCALLIRPDKYIGVTQCPINEGELLRYMNELYISR
nr:FAD-binding protein [Legionella jordanis]